MPEDLIEDDGKQVQRQSPHLSLTPHVRRWPKGEPFSGRPPESETPSREELNYERSQRLGGEVIKF